MYANNMALSRPKASFRTAGGSQYAFKHPFLMGSLKNADDDEVQLGDCLRLNDTFFNAQPLMENAIIETTVSGASIVVTNHVMAGRATLQVLPGDGTVYGGDLTAIAPFIAASKDGVGGQLKRRRYTSARALVRGYYGVAFTGLSHAVDMGNGMPIYAMTMLYCGSQPVREVKLDSVEFHILPDKGYVFLVV